ncbi:MAG: 50S ribosomal protein L10 [Planctomycetota bacterium]|nr:50S ribosomal protein L10 [Planctomycetota bacterium]MDI6787353.1 50S ribosomal protein L10 [Planctomycetota bacterium]
MSQKLKDKVVKELSKKYDLIDHCFLVDYRGMKTDEMTKFRGYLRENKIKVNVVKSSLLKMVKSTKGISFNRLSDFMNVPLALVYSEEIDSINTAKKLMSWTAKNKLPRIKGGYAEGNVINTDEIKKLAQTPSREVLLFLLAATLKAPAFRLARGLSDIISRLPRVLNQYASTSRT